MRRRNLLIIENFEITNKRGITFFQNEILDHGPMWIRMCIACSHLKSYMGNIHSLVGEAG